MNSTWTSADRLLSPEYIEAYCLINGHYPKSDNIINLNTENTLPPTNNIIKNEYLLKNEIEKLNKKISKIDSKISSIEFANGMSALCGLLAIGAGTTSIVAGVDDANNGNIGLGLLEEANGLLLINNGLEVVDDIEVSTQSLSKLYNKRNALKKERSLLRKDMYELEKEKTLRILNQYIPNNQSPMYIAIQNQFTAMDEAIKENIFSKTYIDLAINIRNILKAKTKKERDYYKDNHIEISSKSSIPKVIVGAILFVVGIATFAGSITLAAICSEVGPLAWGGGIIGALTGVLIAAQGFNLIESGMGKERTPLLKQSLFNFVNIVKSESAPEINNIRQYA